MNTHFCKKWRGGSFERFCMRCFFGCVKTLVFLRQRWLSHTRSTRAKNIENRSFLSECVRIPSACAGKRFSHTSPKMLRNSTRELVCEKIPSACEGKRALTHPLNKGKKH